MRDSCLWGSGALFSSTFSIYEESNGAANVAETRSVTKQSREGSDQTFVSNSVVPIIVKKISDVSFSYGIT